MGHWKIAALGYPNMGALRRRADEIDNIFLTENDIERYDLVRKLNIDYLFIGEKEREYYPQCEKKVNDDKMHFKSVFANDEVRVYKVL